MSHKLLTDSRVFEFILKIDADTVAAVATNGYRKCGGRLDRADYPRKPRGVPAEFENSFAKRPSFCCRRDGCRTRRTPTLIAFLGRRVYFSAVVVLAAILRQGANPKRLSDLQRLLGVSARTVRRWLLWWRDCFPVSAIWRKQRAALVPPVDDAALPGALFHRLAAICDDELVGFLFLLRMVAQ